MPDVCFYFQVHQPYRLRRYRVFDIGTGAGLLRRRRPTATSSAAWRTSATCPTNRLLTEAVRRSSGRFRIAMSLSGTLLDQLESDAPDALVSFQELVATGGVELLGETFYHGLSSLRDPEEFREQVELHRAALQRHFGRHATVFRNTELIYDDAIAPMVARLGFSAMLVEGADHVLGWRSPNYVYSAASAPQLRLLPRNYRISDDVGFRFSNRDWDGWPLTADRWTDWIAGAAERQRARLHGLRDLRRAPVGGDRDLRLPARTYPTALERRGHRAACSPSSSPAAADGHAQLPDGDVLGRRRARYQRLAGQSDAAGGLRPALPGGGAAQGAAAIRGRLEALAPAHHQRPLLLHVHEMVRRRRRAQILQSACLAVRRIRGVHERADRSRKELRGGASQPALGGRWRDGGGWGKPRYAPRRYPAQPSFKAAVCSRNSRHSRCAATCSTSRSVSLSAAPSARS